MNSGGTVPDVLCDRMLVGLSGSIGVYSFVHLLLALKGMLAREVRIIQTPSAARMLDARLVGALIDCDVWTDPYDQIADVRIPHSELPDWAELFLIMPATANTIASAAQGQAGTLLTLAILASPRPVGFIPNMGDQMWRAPSTRRNVTQLREDGHLVLDQDTGHATAHALGNHSSTVAPDAADIYQFIRELSATCSRTDSKERLG